MGKRTVITRLEEHPNLAEILGVLAQLAHIEDRHLPLLAAAWSNTHTVADARAKALRPDSPLVIEVLSAFDALVALFNDDLRGEADYVTVDPGVTRVALKAVRDAVAAAYARPTLSRGEHAALLRPWRSVYASPTFTEPDLGPSAALVKALLAAMPVLAARCHDPYAQELFEELVDHTWRLDEDRREAARAEAWRLAVLTDRRRLWALVRRSGAEGLGRPCRDCRPQFERNEEQRVLTLCLDAACALLVSDTLGAEHADVLTQPLSSLVPLPRRPAS